MIDGECNLENNLEVTEWFLTSWFASTSVLMSQNWKLGILTFSNWEVYGSLVYLTTEDNSETNMLSRYPEKCNPTSEL